MANLSDLVGFASSVTIRYIVIRRRRAISSTNVAILHLLFKPVIIAPNKLIGGQFYTRLRGRMIEVHSASQPRSKIHHFKKTLSGEKLNYKSVAKEISKPPFFAPEVQWAYRVCSIHVSFKCFEPRSYLACHVTTIENV